MKRSAQHHRRLLAGVAAALAAAAAAPAGATGAEPWSQPADVPGAVRTSLAPPSFGATGVGAIATETASGDPVLVPIRDGAVGPLEPLRGALPTPGTVARVYGDGRLVSLAVRRGRVLAAFGSVDAGLGRAREIGRHTRGFWSWGVNARGDVAAAFTDAAGVKLAYRPAGGRFRTPVRIARVRRATYVPQATLSPDGDVLVTWQNERRPGIRGRRPGTDALHARRVSRRGRLGPVQRVTDVRGVAAASAALTRGGQALLAWQHETTGETRVAHAPPGRAFGRSQRLEPAGSGGVPFAAPAVRFGAGGEALAAWVGTSDGGRAVRVAELEGEAFEPARTLSTPGVRAALGGLVAGPRGEALVAWEEGEPAAPKTVRASARPPGGDFAAPETIVAGEGTGAFVAIDPASATPYAFWLRHGDPSTLRYATRAPIR